MIDCIKALRERTGAGMMDCKKALEECGMDIEKACDWLREKGIAKAAKKAATRIAAEGLTLVKANGNRAIILEINCETDFVAKGDAFKKLLNDVADTVLEKNCGCLDCAKEAVNDIFTDASVKIGEKLDFRRFTIVEKQAGQEFGYYIHMGGKVSAIALIDKEDAELAKDLSIHIAASKPQYLTKADIPADVIEHETQVQLEAAKNDPKLSGKPEAALVKIIEGKVNKIFADSVLYDQEYIMQDDAPVVGNYLKSKNVNVVKFVCYAVGEGIEKRQENFADEVMKQAQN
ncbi:MAG: elongation factor Ts [Bacilli bacterium]|nr:elongation factor Ts [Bacilli bacterium]